MLYAYVKKYDIEQAAHGVYVSPDVWMLCIFCICAVLREYSLMSLHFFSRSDRQGAEQILYHGKERG